MDLTVREGEIFGLLGPNGSGKTTLLRLFLGLVEPTAGQLWLFGETRPTPAALARIGSLVEEPAFYPWLSGRRNLEVILDAGAPVARHAVRDALDLVSLGGAAGRLVTTYSLGMRQRLALALALARRPDVLLLDEPTNGLDQPGIRRLRTVLRELAVGGTTILLASHTLTEVERLCGRVAVLRAGRLLVVDEPDKIGQREPRVRVVVSPAEQERAEALLCRWGPSMLAPGMMTVPVTTGREVNRVLAEGGVFAETVVAETPDLEERYLNLVTGDGRAPGSR
ncbi:ABC transporter ATP-binding protein [Kutzneria sp. NPDC052558]|uniref:ABC transporter ATP-binding protein n=1 Tax=Kutzneria sp. NPDC052558 TaxID=3364121 RepID=UPI0037CBB8F1